MKGFFNVLKGAYPSLKQLDKTLPPLAGEAIVRGSLIMEAAGKFKLTTDDAAGQGAAPAPGPMVYFALHGIDDPDVEMAGGMTGMPVQAPCEVECSEFDAAGTFAVGGFVMAGAGKLKDHATGATAIGVVTKAPYHRWSNAADAPAALVGKRTGNRVSVVALQTMYIPNLVTA